MKLKQGSKVNGLRTEILLAAIIIDKIYDRHDAELVITEGTGSKHGRGSLHYVGQAIDIRTNYFTKEQTDLVANEIIESLNEQYDVVIEETHIHIEFQPK